MAKSTTTSRLRGLLAELENPKMFTTKGHHTETLPRSDSEIEVDFARPQRTLDKKEFKNMDRVDCQSFSTKPPNEEQNVSEDDTEGSSIIDLRGGSPEKSTLSSQFNAMKSNERKIRRHSRHLSTSNFPSNNDSLHIRTTFHSSLKDVRLDEANGKSSRVSLIKSTDDVNHSRERLTSNINSSKNNIRASNHNLRPSSNTKFSPSSTNFSPSSRENLKSSLSNLRSSTSNLRSSSNGNRRSLSSDHRSSSKQNLVDAREGSSPPRRSRSADRLVIKQESQQVFLKKAGPLRDTSNPRLETSFLVEREHPPAPPHSPTFSFRSTIDLLPSSRSRHGLRQQIIVTTSCSLSPLACGFAMAYNLTNNPNDLLTQDLGKWREYIFLLGALTGGFFSGVILNHGRRIPLIATTFILMLSWFAALFAKEVWMVFLFHGTSGACSSICLVLAQVYIAEIAVPSMRGALSCTPILAFHVGLLLCYLMGEVVTWKNLAIAGLTTTMPFFISVVLCMPESPRHLIHCYPNDALATLQWLRGHSSDVMDEYRDIADCARLDRWVLHCSSLARPSFWRPLVASCGLFFFANMTGVSSFASYAHTTLFIEVSTSYRHLAHFLITSVVIVGVTISALLLDQVGRKLLLLLSLTIMAASSFALGLFLFLKDLHRVSNYFSYQWAAEVFCIVLFSLAHATALGPVSWVTLGEGFSPKHKWIGVTIASMVMWASRLVVDVFYLKVSLLVATGGVFWLHCILCVIGYIFVLIFFRELKDQKIDNITRVYCKKTESLIDTFITKI